jgi:Tol biopolymer transport system component
MKPLAASGELYRVPFLGGSPTLVLAGISGAPALSPDGRKVAFVRSTLVTHGEDSIVTASIDGSGERTLISYSAPGIHFNRVTWTPDGTTLVYPVQSTLMAISADGGKALPVTGAKWTEIDDVWKLPPGRDLVVVGSASASILAQILQVSLAGGGIHALTHDLSNYTSVRVTADGKALLAVQQLVLSSVQVLAPGGESGNRSLSAENQNQDGVSGLAWTPDGKIVYTSQSERRSGLIEIDSDGSNPRRFADGDASSTLFSDPVVSPSGDFIAVARWSLGDGANIWRMNRSGGDSQRLTNGRQDFPPSITPDGQWIVYASVQGDKSILMKVASQGGTPIKLTDYDADSPSVSPDGRWIACAFTPHQDQPASLAIVPIAGGQPVKVFRLPETATPQSLAWTPDGRAVSFIENMNGASNIWQQPAAGGAATALTHFAAAKIFTFRWSRDGKLALSRGSESMDAVLIKDFREPGR